MNSLNIPVSQVKITNQKIIESLLPENPYWLRGSDPDFDILVGGMVCANISVRNGQLNFLFAEQGYPGLWGSELKKLLVQKYPELDQERIVWQIFWCFAGAYSAAIHYYETKEQALASLTQFQVNQGAYLCSLKAKFVGQNSFWTETAYRIDQNFLPGKNLGSMKVVLTNLKILK